MGQQSRARHKAKRKAEQERQRRRTATDPLGIFANSAIPSPREQAEDFIDAALHARDRGDVAGLRQCRKLLAEGPGGLAGVQLVNRALLTALTTDLEQAWQRGWQPAELVRMARREHTARHGRMLTDVTAAQMRGYPVATVDARWQAQLNELDTRVWWEHDDHYLDHWAAAESIERGEAIDHALDLLYLLSTMPSIEPTGPLPGTAHPVAQATNVDQRMLDKVRALLAKAESTDFPEEAEAFTAKAQQLMARHSIDHALLAARNRSRDQPITRRIGIDNPYESPKSLLLQVVAEANRCRAVWMKRFGLTAVIGFPADIDATELLFTSLLVQATRAMNQETSARRDTIRSFRQSFLTAYAIRIGERLSTATDQATQEAAAQADSTGLLPVLAARSDAVNDAFAKQFPALTSHETRISNFAGWTSGRAAADRATLHGSEELTGKVAR